MKIALLYHEVPPMMSGIGSYTYDLAKKLSENNIDVVLICAKYQKKDSIEKVNSHLKIYRLSTPNVPPRFVWFQLKNKKKIVDILEKEKIDVLHGQSSSCLWIFKAFKGKKILTMHGTIKNVYGAFRKIPIRYLSFGDVLYYFIGYPVWYYLEKNEIQNADKVITFNKNVANSIKNQYNYHKRINIIFQGIDVARISEIRPKKENKPYLFFGGRLTYIKGVVQLVSAFKEVHKKYPNLQLRIFGDGPLKGKIEKYIKQNKLENSIILHGAVSRDTLISYIKGSEFGVLPSFYEAQSIVMLETIASGKTFICLDLQFIRNTIVEKGALVLSSKEDIQKSLINGIVSLLNYTKMYASTDPNIQSVILDNSSWDRLILNYQNLYSSFIEGRI